MAHFGPAERAWLAQQRAGPSPHLVQPPVEAVADPEAFWLPGAHVTEPCVRAGEQGAPTHTLHQQPRRRWTRARAESGASCRGFASAPMIPLFSMSADTNTSPSASRKRTAVVTSMYGGGRSGSSLACAAEAEPAALGASPSGRGAPNARSQPPGLLMRSRGQTGGS